MKLLVDYWQTTSVPYEFLNAIHIPNPIPASLLTIKPFSLPARFFRCCLLTRASKKIHGKLMTSLRCASGFAGLSIQSPGACLQRFWQCADMSALSKRRHIAALHRAGFLQQCQFRGASKIYPCPSVVKCLGSCSFVQFVSTLHVLASWHSNSTPLLDSVMNLGYYFSP